MMPTVWQDGRLIPAAEARLPAFDHTVLFGRGVFETLRLRHGVPFLIERHLERLRAGAALVGIELPRVVDDLPRALGELAQACSVTEAVARITCTAGDGSVPGSVLVHLRDVPPVASPVSVGVAPFAHDARSPIAGVKATNYLVHDILRGRARSAGRYDDLLVTTDGRVTEGTAANVFLVLDGRLVTPPCEGVLAGITRGLVLELAAERGLEASERQLDQDELGDATEAFVTNAALGPVSIDVLDGRELGHPRPVSECLVSAYRARVEDVCRPG